MKGHPNYRFGEPRLYKTIYFLLLLVVLTKLVIPIYGYSGLALDIEEGEEEGGEEGEGRGAGWGIASLLYIALAIIILVSIAPYLIRRIKRRV